MLNCWPFHMKINTYARQVQGKKIRNIHLCLVNVQCNCTDRFQYINSFKYMVSNLFISLLNTSLLNCIWKYKVKMSYCTYQLRSIYFCLKYSIINFFPLRYSEPHDLNRIKKKKELWWAGVNMSSQEKQTNKHHKDLSFFVAALVSTC